MTEVAVKLPVMIHADELFELKGNSQKQSKHEFAELRKSIRENGFDETLLVVPRKSGGYDIVAGNHRFKGGIAEGMSEFPCVIQENWDAIKVDIEAVRRNYVRGKIDKDLFSHTVNQLSEGSGMSMEDIYTEMGFANADDFSALYKEDKEREANFAKMEEEAASSDAGIVKMIDDLGFIVSSLLNKYGDTISDSFIIFPTGGKNHLFIASTPALKKTMGSIATACAAQHLDMNVALGGILSIGLANTNFLEGHSGRQEILDENEACEGLESDLDLLF